MAAKVVVLYVLVDEDDEQDLVDGLIHYVEHDPWSVGSDLERRGLTDEERETWAAVLADWGGDSDAAVA